MLILVISSIKDNSKAHLNTSYVNVNPVCIESTNVTDGNLNTSYVNVNRIITLIQNYSIRI